MRLDALPRSDRIEDRRADGGGGAFAFQAARAVAASAPLLCSAW
jgi:hypothetical protein